MFSEGKFRRDVLRSLCVRPWPHSSKADLEGQHVTSATLESVQHHGSNEKVITVEFGKLFEHYVSISNKLVGILLRARKQRLVDFEGEMLWQGKDDHVVITLLQ
uniref:Costars domain-containing protein n=1 Tax=Amphilophus citrinellus TaxID=61819 RepID=A0A3Q0T1F6_AMPCI